MGFLRKLKPKQEEPEDIVARANLNKFIAEHCFAFTPERKCQGSCRSF